MIPVFETICDLIDSPDELFSALTICSVCCYFAIGIPSGMIIIPCIYSFFQQIFLLSHIYEITFVISFILLLFICILLGIVIPNKLAQIRPEYYLTKYLSFLLLFSITIRPLINMMSHIANILLMITGTNPPSADSVTEDEVKDS